MSAISLSPLTFMDQVQSVEQDENQALHDLISEVRALRSEVRQLRDSKNEEAMFKRVLSEMGLNKRPIEIWMP